MQANSALRRRGLSPKMQQNMNVSVLQHEFEGLKNEVSVSFSKYECRHSILI